MFNIRPLLATAATAAMLFVMGCADRIPTVPSERGRDLEVVSPPPAHLTTDTNTYRLLTRDVPLLFNLATTECIAPSRNKTQSIKLLAAGVTLSFPPGAVLLKTCVTVTAYAGRYVVYDFQPHGMIFLQPVQIQQDLRVTNAYHDDAVMSQLVAGYLQNGLSDTDLASGLANFAELFLVYFIDAGMNLKKTSPTTARFYTHHFSGYALASGRAGQ